MEERFRTGSGLAVVGGALLVVSLFLEWFGEEGTCASDSCSAFKTFSAVDIILLGLGVAAILLGLVGLTAPGRAPSVLLSLAGLTAFGIVITMLVEFGDDLSSKVGLYLALVASIATSLGAMIATPGRAMLAPPTVGPGGPPRGKIAPGAVSPGATAPAQPASSMPAPSGGAAAGWYPDPTGAAAQRYWDGTRWTDHTA